MGVIVWCAQAQGSFFSWGKVYQKSNFLEPIQISHSVCLIPWKKGLDLARTGAFGVIFLYGAPSF